MSCIRHIEARSGEKEGGGRNGYGPLPILMTNVYGRGGTSIHSPERFCTCRPA
jgi:hypothetical protein